jgi:hypothetical protein
MATKKLRADAATSAVKAMQNAAKAIPQPPSHVALRPQDKAFWTGIYKARSVDEWTDAHMVIGAQLARSMADLEKQQELLDIEGAILENARGTMVMNPRVTVLEGLARREMALMRALGLTGKANVDPRDTAGKRKIESQSRKLREELEDDELLA